MVLLHLHHTSTQPQILLSSTRSIVILHSYLSNNFCYFWASRAILKSSITWQCYICTLTGRFCPPRTLQSYEELRYRIYMNCLPTACPLDLLGAGNTTVFSVSNTQSYFPGSFISSTWLFGTILKQTSFRTQRLTYFKEIQLRPLSNNTSCEKQTCWKQPKWLICHCEEHQWSAAITPDENTAEICTNIAALFLWTPVPLPTHFSFSLWMQTKVEACGKHLPVKILSCPFWKEKKNQTKLSFHIFQNSWSTDRWLIQTWQVHQLSQHVKKQNLTSGLLKISVLFGIDIAFTEIH